MPGPISLTEPCCAPACEEPVSIQVPGPAGEDGVDGVDGAAGVSAFTLTTAQFLMPAEGATAPVSVLDTSWMVVGQILFIQTAGYMTVSSITDADTVVLLNPENTASSLYASNAAPTTAIPASSKVSPGGIQGPSGALTGAAGGDLEGTFPNPALEITTTKGDLVVNNAGGTAPRNTRLGVGDNGDILHADSGTGTGLRWGNLDLSGAATDIAGEVPIANGGTGQATANLGFAALSPMTTRGDLITRNATVPVRLGVGTVGQIVKSDGTDISWGKVLPVNIDMASGPLPRYGLLGSFIGANFNTTADQAIIIQTGVTRYIIRRIIVDNASVSPATAVGGIYSNAGKAGTIIVAAGQAYTGLTASTKFKDLTLEAVIGTDVLTATTIYLSLTTPHGVAVTANVWVFGENMTP